MTVPIRFINSGYGRTNITAATNLGVTSSGDMRQVERVIVVVTGVTDSTIIDSTGTSATAANTILIIPAGTDAGTIFPLEYPCSAGIGVVPGTGATLAVVYQ